MAKKLSMMSAEEQIVQRAKAHAYYIRNREHLLALSKAAQKIRYASNKEFYQERYRRMRDAMTEEERDQLRLRRNEANRIAYHRRKSGIY